MFRVANTLAQRITLRRTTDLIYVIGVNIYSIEDYIGPPMRGYRGALSQTQRCKLVNLFCRAMEPQSWTNQLLQGILEPSRNKCLANMYVNYFDRCSPCICLIGIKWFPMAYYGGPSHGGVDGHYYHVFGTVSNLLVRPLPLVRDSLTPKQPLYYLLPLNATI